jgi:RNA polymerase sigma factor (sigma-70 family)
MSPNSEPELEDLLQQAVAGNQQARNQLLETLLPRLRAQVNCWLNIACRGARSDVLCSVIRRIIQPGAHVPSTYSEFNRWVGAIVKNRCHDEWRQAIKKPRPLPSDYPLVSKEGNPPEVAIREEEHDRRSVLVWGALQLLKERERIILEHAFYHELSAKEIAARTGLSEINVRVIQHRGLKKLSKLLENPNVTK